jgi:hypothetical protein
MPGGQVVISGGRSGAIARHRRIRARVREAPHAAFGLVRGSPPPARSARIRRRRALGLEACGAVTAADSIGCAAIAPASEQFPLAIELDLIGPLAGRAASEADAIG